MILKITNSDRLNKESAEKGVFKMTTVKFEGKNYILDGEADFTSRLLPGGYVNYSEAGEDGKYDFEMSAPAHDEKGNQYIVYWIFESKFYSNGEPFETDEYDYGNVDRVEEI